MWHSQVRKLKCWFAGRHMFSLSVRNSTKKKARGYSLWTKMWKLVQKESMYNSNNTLSEKVKQKGQRVMSKDEKLA